MSAAADARKVYLAVLAIELRRTHRDFAVSLAIEAWSRARHRDQRMARGLGAQVENLNEALARCGASGQALDAA